ncbi:hemolysin, lipoprotein [Legionella shakespearei DSM 23087]|uniref:Hemolysin, lipoprotein n=2 Tax=Legionella shakespearei TaxID=45075 RepID=A0A0W0YZZ4_9GAMM|nr:hemolysin, lipoprotein [Legionella shakespearei DSM 23087]
MLKQGRLIATYISCCLSKMKWQQALLVVLLAYGLSACVGSLWTGASLVYDRHDVYKKLNDYHLLVQVNDVLAVNRTFNQSSCVLDIAVFNGDILIAGHVPDDTLFDELRNRLAKLRGYRRLFNEVKVKAVPSNNMQDTWITTQIRSRIFADASIDPNAFKVITSDRIVYLMGDVKPDEAEKVVTMARYTKGVDKVVKVMKYFTYQN